MNLLPLRLAAQVTRGSRLNTPIDTVVIHVTEGGFDGTLNWFEHGAPASAHYVIALDGRICPCVPEEQAAWHAGNKAVNLRSIGIELEGHTETLHVPAEQMLALGDLVCDIRRRHPDIGLDRDHLIGHCEVPDPTRPGLFGGAGHHIDPGPHFDWTLFLAQLVPDFNV